MVQPDEALAPGAYLPATQADLDWMLGLLERLVNHESPSNEPDSAAACLRAFQPELDAALGRSSELVVSEGRTHLSAPAPGGTAHVLLVGHIDTVWPSGTLARWPYSREGDRITGPGCFDMKAGLVQMLAALRALSATGTDLSTVAAVVTTDEELGSPTSRELIEKLARTSKAALVLEPSADGALKIARKGVSMYRIDVTGRAAHAGLEPQKGANAVLGLAHVLLDVPPIARMEIGTSVTPTTAAAGTTTNTVPAQAHVMLDVRAETVEEQLRVDREVRALSTPVEGTSVSVEGGPNRPPMEEALAKELFAQAEQVCADLGLQAPEGVGVGGGSDGNFTAGVGVRTLDGLGAVGGNAHAEGEWVSAEAMPARAALVAGLIARLLQA